MKHKRTVLLLTLVSFFVPLFIFAGGAFQEESTANAFVKTIDGIGHFMAGSQTSDEGYLSVSASTKGPTDWFTDALTVTKLSASGKMLWESSLEINIRDWELTFNEIRGIVEVKDGYILVGNAEEWDHGIAPLLMKLDAKGSIVWSKYLCAQASYVPCSLRLNSVAAQPDGTFLVTGGSADSNTVVIKFSATGNPIWTKVFPQLKLLYQKDNVFYPSDLVSSPTTDHGFVLATRRLKNYKPDGVYLLKVNNNGQPIWNRILQVKDFYPGLIRATSDNGTILIDSKRNIIVKLNPGGHVQWATRYFLNTKDGWLGLADVVQTADGGYAIVGSTQFSEYGESILLKIDRNGRLVFQKRLGNKNSKRVARTIFSTTDQGFVIFGSRFAFDTQSQLVVRVNSSVELSGCNFIASLNSVKQDSISGIRTSWFQLQKPSTISFAIGNPDVTSVKVKGSIKAICE